MKLEPSVTEITSSESKSPCPLYSRLAADPVLGQLVDLFVKEMPDRIGTFKAQARSQDWSQLARNAHQLKGSAGSYGFDEITSCAARLEATVRDDGQEETIILALNELLSLCRGVRSGTPQDGARPSMVRVDP